MTHDIELILPAKELKIFYEVAKHDEYQNVRLRSIKIFTAKKFKIALLIAVFARSTCLFIRG